MSSVSTADKLAGQMAGFLREARKSWEAREAIRGTVLLGNTAPGWLAQGSKFFLGAEQLQGGLDHYDPAEKPDAAAPKAADKAT